MLQNETRIIENICLIVMIAFFCIGAIVICEDCAWIEHSNITIEVKEKYIDGSQLYIISKDNVTYNVRTNINYAKLTNDKTYEVAVAHNPFIGTGFLNSDGAWNIDNVIREV